VKKVLFSQSKSKQILLKNIVCVNLIIFNNKIFLINGNLYIIILYIYIYIYILFYFILYYILL